MFDKVPQTDSPIIWPQGIRGEKGDKWDAGEKGRDWETPVINYEKIIGNLYEKMKSDIEFQKKIKGVDGINWINGTNGVNWFDWKDWLSVQWPKGDRGSDGKNGFDGKDGINWRDGINGKDGINWKDGKDGVNGKDWAPGKDWQSIQWPRGAQWETGDWVAVLFSNNKEEWFTEEYKDWDKFMMVKVWKKPPQVIKL